MNPLKDLQRLTKRLMVVATKSIKRKKALRGLLKAHEKALAQHKLDLLEIASLKKENDDLRLKLTEYTNERGRF